MLDNSLLKIAVILLSSISDIDIWQPAHKIAPEPRVYILHSVYRKIFGLLLDFGY